MASGCLLLVDDDDDYINLMSMVLRSEGYSVDCAYNGLEAVERVSKFKYDVILSDLVMPGLRGDEVAERVRLIDNKIAIILLTGCKSAIDRSKSSLFDEILEKPVSPEVVLKVIVDVSFNKIQSSNWKIPGSKNEISILASKIN